MLKNKVLLAKNQNSLYTGKAVFVFRHDELGAEGVILNPKKLGYVVFDPLSKEFYLALDEHNIGLNHKVFPLYHGGLAPTLGIYFIHGYGNTFKNNLDNLNIVGQQFFKNLKSDMQICGDVCFGTPTTLCNILASEDKDAFRFYSGQVFWEPFQLEKELELNYWDIIEINSCDFFKMEIFNRKFTTFYDIYKIFQSPSDNFNPIWN